MFEPHHLLALSVMGLAGMLGAGVTEVIAWSAAIASAKPGEAPMPKPKIQLGRIIVLGLAAAAAVPVFLSIASTGQENQLLAAVLYSTRGLSETAAATVGKDFAYKLVLVASFCVIAGFAAQRLFETLATQLLRRVENSEKTANAALEEAARVKADAEKLKKEADAAKAAADLAKAEAEKAQKEAVEIKARTAELSREVDATKKIAMDAAVSQEFLAEAAFLPPRVTRTVTGAEVKNLVLDRIKAVPFGVPRGPGGLALELKLDKDQVEEALKALTEEGAVEKAPFRFDPEKFNYSLSEGLKRDDQG